MNQPEIGVGAGGPARIGVVVSASRGPASKSFSIQSYPVHALALSPDGKRVAFGGWDEAVYVYDMAEGGKVFTYRGHTGPVWAVAWSPDGAYIASAGGTDSTLQVWSATTRSNILIARYQSRGGVIIIGWSVDGKRIRVGHHDGSIQELDATTGNDVFTYHQQHPYGDIVRALTWTQDGTRIAIGSEDRKVLVYDTVEDNTFVCRAPAAPVEVSGPLPGRGDQYAVKSITWSPDNKRVASANRDNSVQVWDAATGSHVFTWRVRSPIQVVEEVWPDYSGFTQSVGSQYAGGPIRGMAWSPDGRHIASVSLDNTIHIWEVVTGRNILIYRGHAHCVWSVTCSPDSKRIASASEDGTVQIWDVNTGKNVFTYQSHSAPIRTVAWSPDGKYIASGGDDSTVRVWNASNGNDIYIYRKHNDSVLAAAWSPDSKRIASGGADQLVPTRDDRRTVQIWDAMNGDNVVSCNGSAFRTDTVTWSPDGKYIASSEGLMVQVWNAATGDPVKAYHWDPVKAFQGHHNNEVSELLHVSWSPDGTRLAASDKNGKIWVGSIDLPGVPKIHQ